MQCSPGVTRPLDEQSVRPESNGRRFAALLSASYSDAEDLEKALRSVEYADKGDDPAEDIARWASALGAFTAYVYCGSAVIDPDRFAAAAVKHYEARGKRDFIAGPLLSSSCVRSS
jgi:hypothetical protein